MPPITIHNLPVPPREVQLAFDSFNAYLASSAPVEHTVGSEIAQFKPTELSYCALLLDTGHQSWGHRHMIIECHDDGYSWIMHAVFNGDELMALTYCGDDDDAINTVPTEEGN